MKQIVFMLFIWAAAALPDCMQAQILTVTPGTDLTIIKGTIFSADQLIITPSADFTLNNISLNRYTTVSHAINRPFIARVYQFFPTSNLFYGSVQFGYRNGAELNGIPETRLELNVFNGTNWIAFKPASLDTTNNFVLTGLDAEALNELTLAEICPGPVINPKADIVISVPAGANGIVVGYQLPLITDACGYAVLTQIAGLRSGAIFPVGSTTNTFVASNSSGKSAITSFTVTVKENDLFSCTVQPNPSSHHFNILISSASHDQIEANLLDGNGRLLSRLRAEKNKTLRVGNDLRPGVYLVEIKQGQQHKTIKLVKQ